MREPIGVVTECSGFPLLRDPDGAAKEIKTGTVIRSQDCIDTSHLFGACATVRFDDGIMQTFEAQSGMVINSSTDIQPEAVVEIDESQGVMGDIVIVTDEEDKKST
jgi:hypothetical protein